MAVPPAFNPDSLREMQALIQSMFGHKDSARGVEGTFMWFIEEVGELGAALRERDAVASAGEFADVLAWLATLANMSGIDLADAMALKYGGGCPRCGHAVCGCDRAKKP